MPSRQVDLGTIEEWRELGLFYEVDEPERLWTLTGDRQGLLNFSKKLRDYANNPKNQALSEHEHFGPYFYLKIITGKSPAIDGSGWTGTLGDFLSLAQLIEGHLSHPGQLEFVIGSHFAPGSIWAIKFRVEKDGFDPSSIDPSIQHRS
jgi:hypothetical protein